MTSQNEQQIQSSLALFENNRLAPCWIIVGKIEDSYNFAKKLASEILCSSLNQNPIKPDTIVRHINNNTYGNYLYLTSKAGENEMVVDDLEPLTKFIQHRSTFPGARIAIINNLNLMNRFVSNSLLKKLEEPPANTYIFLLATHLGNVLPTIRSRCQKLLVMPDEQQDLQKNAYRNLVEQVYDLALQGNMTAIQRSCESVIQNGDKENYAILIECFLEYLSNKVIDESCYEFADRWLMLSQFWLESQRRHIDVYHAFITMMICFHNPSYLVE